MKNDRMELFIGAHETKDIDEKKLYEVEQKWIHEFYDSITLENDFCLMKTKRSMILDETADIVCLPEQDNWQKIKIITNYVLLYRLSTIKILKSRKV